MTSSAIGYFELLDECENIETVTGTKNTLVDITSLQEKIAKPFIRHLNDKHFFASSGDVVQSIEQF